MGTVPVRLRDDWPPAGFGPPCGCSTADDEQVCWPLLDTWQIRRRIVTGYDRDDNPEYDWTVEAEAPASVESHRREEDQVQGSTVEKIKVQMWTIQRFGETSELYNTADGSHWRITGQDRGPASTTVSADRVDV